MQSSERKSKKPLIVSIYIKNYADAVRVSASGVLVSVCGVGTAIIHVWSLADADILRLGCCVCLCVPFPIRFSTLHFNNKNNSDV